MQSRRKSRELALQVLFQDEFQLGLDFRVSLKNFEEAFKEERANFQYAEFLLNGIKDKLSDLDAKIEANSRHWKLDRMALLDKSILRIATFELLFCAEDVPPNIVINEAIELAKTYSSTESGGFVNGILDEIRKSL